MKSSFKKRILMLPVICVAVMSFMFPSNHVNIYLAGDSTIADKEKKARPETGWGMPFKAFFDTTVTVVNKAKNGRSTRTFISEGIWKSITDQLKPGDYVLIQFGHNDENKSRPEVFTPLVDYQANLKQMVADARAKQAVPVLITPVAQRIFDSGGEVVDGHGPYAAAVRQVAMTNQVPLIDLDTEVQALVARFGPEDSKLLYMYLEPGENTNYPEGRIDNTHFSELGARKVAELVLRDIKTLKLELARHIVVSNYGTHF